MRDAAVVHRQQALELQGLSGLARSTRALLGLARSTRAIMVSVACAALLLGSASLSLPPPAQARSVPTTLLVSKRTVTTTAVASSGQPVLVTELNRPPPGFRLTAAQALSIAERDRRVRAELRRHPDAIPYEYTKGVGQWQVSWFSSGRHQKELLQVYLDDQTGEVTQVWTGFQVAWTMARGYPGAFGERVNALYIWLPMCFLFIAPFLPWRRVGGARRLRLAHLDLLALLGFSISLAFFNHALIGLSVPLVYPFLLYLLARMLLLASGRGRAREPLPLGVPVGWLAVGAVFLMGFRIGLNVLNSNVIDVGYAGVIGADKLLHGHALYGHWPPDNAYGDTYGPVNYLAYVPFRAIFGWSGTWDELPAAHAAAISFDVLTMAALFLLGLRLRSRRLGVVLAYLWASYPFSLFVLSSDSNDSLVALLVVAALLVTCWGGGRHRASPLASEDRSVPARDPARDPASDPARDPASDPARDSAPARVPAHGAALARDPARDPASDPARDSAPARVPAHGAALARGAILALAGLTKFAPLGLGPLFWRGIGGPPRRRSLVGYPIAFALTATVVMLPVLVHANLRTFWHDTVVYQATRPAPFSIWGLWGGLGVEQHTVQALTVLLALGAAVWPRRRGFVEVAALAAAILIMVELSLTYWFYLYIVWFFPLVAVALVGAHPEAALPEPEPVIEDAELVPA